MGNAPSKSETTCDNSMNINFNISSDNKISYQFYTKEAESNPIDSVSSVYFHKTT
ncbi:hypothetical protein RB653_000104 [Dictyostelium firmibasis]|uniref:Uncharacterized protein n=1 Tax=Dictyostelium firmibasis TaxID=79012 RepID=A0AAN7U2P5_9MYCE